jgi:hypothetical protein
MPLDADERVELPEVIAGDGTLTVSFNEPSQRKASQSDEPHDRPRLSTRLDEPDVPVAEVTSEWAGDRPPIEAAAA